MDDTDAPDGFVLTVDDLDGITQEELDDLEETADEFLELIEEYEQQVDQKMEEINDSSVYEKLGKELHVSVEYLYSFDDRED